MKKIQPARRYDLDHGYPCVPEPEPVDPGRMGRRRSLGLLGAGIAALGGSLLLGTEAAAGPAPAQDPYCPTILTLKPRFHLSGSTYGHVVLESTDTRLIATLGQPTESKKVRHLVSEALRKGWAYDWHLDPQRVKKMLLAIANALLTHYRQKLRRPLAALEVQLVIIPPAAPRRRELLSTPGVPPRPRHRGCASCATADDSADLIAPLAITVLGLYALRRRRIAVSEPTTDDDENDYDA